MAWGNEKWNNKSHKISHIWIKNVLEKLGI